MQRKSSSFSDLPPSYEESERPPSYEQAQKDWAKKLSEEDRAKYKNYLDRLDDEQRQELLRKKQDLQKQRPDLYPAGGDLVYLDAYDIWFMSRLAENAIYLQIEFSRAAFQILKDVGPSLGHGLAKIGAGIGHAVGGGGGDGCGEAGFIIAAIAVVTAAITASAAAAAYAIKKACSSVTNLVAGEKVGRSLFRLAATGGGAYIGAVKGALAGAAIGSALPLIGTAAGAIIGAICGGCMGAGVGACISKYTSQFVSWVRNRNSKTAVSQTNPDKYTLSTEVEADLSNKGIDTFKMLSALRCQKNKESGFAGSIPGTNASKCKADYNDLLKAIKKGANPESVTVNNTLFAWNGSEWNTTHLKESSVGSEEQRTPLLAKV